MADPNATNIHLLPPLPPPPLPLPPPGVPNIAGVVWNGVGVQIGAGLQNIVGAQVGAGPQNNAGAPVGAGPQNNVRAQMGVGLQNDCHKSVSGWTIRPIVTQQWNRNDGAPAH